MGQNDPDDFLMGGGGKSASFLEKDVAVSGVILSKEMRQQRDLDTGKLKFWDDGSPVMQMVVGLQTDDRDPDDEDDDGVRNLYIRYKMRDAVRDAVKAAGAKALEIGGTLSVWWSDSEKPKKRGHNGTKLYAAEYEPPTEAFFADEDPADEEEEPPRRPAKKAPAKAARRAPEPVDDDPADEDDEEEAPPRRPAKKAPAKRPAAKAPARSRAAQYEDEDAGF